MGQKNRGLAPIADRQNAINGVVLVAFFILFMWFFGFNAYEKSLFTGTVKKVLQKMKHR